MRYAPYALVFRRLVRPRLAPPDVMEDATPPRFAQLVGMVFGVVGVIGLLSGASALGLVVTGLAFAAAFLNAAFEVCLGCHMYVFFRSVTVKGARG